MRVVIVTLDSHLASAVDRARVKLRKEIPGIELTLHAIAEWGGNPIAAERCREDIEKADVIVATMLFMDNHIRQVLPWLEARQKDCDVLMAGMSAGEVMRLTRLGQFSMSEKASGVINLLKKLRGASKTKQQSSGARQMAMLRQIPRFLKFIPGKAQDVRAYFIALQYWLAGSDQNVANLVRHLVNRYASGPREHLRGTLKPGIPEDYPETGLYHPGLKSKITTRVEDLPKVPARKRAGTVGLLVMRSYVLAGNTGHYDGVISALEARGLNVIPAFACGLDARPAVEMFFKKSGKPVVDSVVSLTGFSLVGGPAYNDAKAAEEALKELDVPYLTAHAVEFQTLEAWQDSTQGLTPVEATMMVAIPELDGATGAVLFGGRSTEATGPSLRDMHVCAERADMLARRVHRLISLRKKERKDRKLAVVLFNFPPNSGATGTAAHLSVFASLFNALTRLKGEGYTVEVPESVEALQKSILEGNAKRHGMAANVCAKITNDEHVRTVPWLDELEAQWGSAPGRHQTDGRNIFVLGVEFGNVFVGIQPAFGYEGDPMRLLFEQSHTPTHAFCAFYQWLRNTYEADAVLHFGTHGALEFMPGKQTALSAQCWPDRLISDLPNFYLYAANNPSEGTIAKRRAAATLISYQTPPVTQAGLYKSLLELKATLDRWRKLDPSEKDEKARLAETIKAQAEEIDLLPEGTKWAAKQTDKQITKLAEALLEFEYALIPHGLHILGEPPAAEERADLLSAFAEASHGITLEPKLAKAISEGKALPKKSGLDAEIAVTLETTNALLSEDNELPGLVRALDTGFVPPAPGGDLLRSPDVLPTGRNIHGFDPMRIPSAFAIEDGARQAGALLERHTTDGHALPETIAVVLWGTDNLKTEGGPIGQALALMGARPRFDSYGRLCGAELIPLEELGRPRIDVVMTLSGIFRDLLPLQVKLLAEASHLAAEANEPESQNFIRKHALAHMKEHGCDLETAALRVFSNAEGAYGSNVNQLIDAGCWQDDDELAETYSRRKSFAYSREGVPAQQTALLGSILKGVDLTYQNLDSVELGVTTIDHYFDTLGGISQAVRRSSGNEVPVYISDQTRSAEGKVRTIAEQVALETRTRTLNPKWYESMLEHGHEGVRHIESQVSNTMGWSATTGQVQPWVYKQISQTFVLDEEMRNRLADLNPAASAKLANRLLEAHERDYWTPDDDVLEALRQAGDELEDRLEGLSAEAAA